MRLPALAGQHIEVVVNGLPQVEGADYFIVGRLIVFDRALMRGEQRAALCRWLDACLGIQVGGDTVDVHFQVGAATHIAGALAFHHC